MEGTGLPLASFPWNRSLIVLPSHSLAMLGRFLRVALTFCNRDSSTQRRKVVFKLMEDEQAQLNTNFLLAARQDLAAALGIVPQILAFATQLVRTVTTDAPQRCALYPESGFFAAVYGKRLGQAAGMERFAEEVMRRVTFETQGVPSHIRAERAVGMWQEFLGGWMPTSLSGPYCDGVHKRWSAIKQSGVSPADGHSNGPGGGTSPIFTVDGGAAGTGGDGGATRNAGGGTTVAGGQAQAAQEFRRTIPCD